MPVSDSDILFLYGTVRNQMLSRHWLMGRYFVANLMSNGNNLGYSTPVSSNPVVDSATQILSSDQRFVPPAYAQPTGDDLCRNSQGLLSNSDPTAPIERWRIIEHIRENPHLIGGQVLTCLAIEHALGQPDSLAMITSFLQSMDQLFKFRGNPATPFDGYIIRRDVARSDLWVTTPVPSPYGSSTQVAQPVSCVEFLTQGEKYLYCTPLDDSRYTSTMYSNPILYRDWEPSMDEIVGLMTGYWMVFDLVDDPTVKGLVVRQVGDMMAYLEHNFYLLARPIGGFTYRGAAGPNSGFAIPFRSVAKRITGSDHAMSPDFNNILNAQGVYSRLSQQITGLRLVVGVIGAVAALGILGALLPAAVLTAGTIIVPAIAALVAGVGIGAAALGEAWALAIAGRNNLDVQSPGDFSIAYLLSYFSVSQRFQLVMSYYGSNFASSNAPGEGFMPFIGLTAFDDTDPTVRDAYLSWLSDRRGKDAAYDPVNIVKPNGQGSTANAPFASGVASVLGSGPAEEANLRSHIDSLFGVVTNTWQENLVLFDYKGGQFMGPSIPPNASGPNITGYSSAPGAPITSYNGKTLADWGLSTGQIAGLQGYCLPQENNGTTLDYMLAVALAWLRRKKMADLGTPLPANSSLPGVPDLSGADAIPTVSIPTYVVAAAAAGTLSSVPPSVIAASVAQNSSSEIPMPTELDPYSGGGTGLPLDTPPVPPAPPGGSLDWVITNAQSAMYFWNASNTVSIDISTPPMPSGYVIPPQMTLMPFAAVVPSAGNSSYGPPDMVISFQPTHDGNWVYQGTATVTITAGNTTSANYQANIVTSLQLQPTPPPPP